MLRNYRNAFKNLLKQSPVTMTGLIKNFEITVTNKIKCHQTVAIQYNLSHLTFDTFDLPHEYYKMEIFQAHFFWSPHYSDLFSLVVSESILNKPLTHINLRHAIKRKVQQFWAKLSIGNVVIYNKNSASMITKIIIFNILNFLCSYLMVMQIVSCIIIFK